VIIRVASQEYYEYSKRPLEKWSHLYNDKCLGHLLYYESYTEELAAQKECFSHLTQKEISRFVSLETLRCVAG
jgi:hypothetical protein